MPPSTTGTDLGSAAGVAVVWENAGSDSMMAKRVESRARVLSLFMGIFKLILNSTFFLRLRQRRGGFSR
jgi:hypothetical protein